MNIGSYLKQLRIEKGYTLNDAAEKVSMSASFISQLENMKLSPSLESLEKLVSLYAINEVPVKLQEGDSINYKSYIPCRITAEEGFGSELLISGVPPLLL